MNMIKTLFAYIGCLSMGFLTLMGVEVSRAFIPWDLIIALKKSAYLESIILFFDVLRISIVLALLSFGVRELYNLMSNWVTPIKAAFSVGFIPAAFGIIVIYRMIEYRNWNEMLLNSLFVLWMPILIYLFRREAERTSSKS